MLECPYPNAPIVKVWGLQRSFSNWLYWSVRDNFEVVALQSILGWKHAVPPVMTPNGCKWGKDTPTEESHPTGEIWGPVREALHGKRKVYSLYAVKPPVQWAASFTRYRGPRPLPKLAAMWNEATAHYTARAEAGEGIIVAYRSLLTAFDTELDRIATYAGLKALSTPYRRRTRVLRRTGDITTPTTATMPREFAPDRYLTGRTPYTADEEAEIISLIDPALTEAVNRLSLETPVQNP